MVNPISGHLHVSTLTDVTDGPGLGPSLPLEDEELHPAHVQTDLHVASQAANDINVQEIRPEALLECLMVNDYEWLLIMVVNPCLSIGNWIMLEGLIAYDHADME